MCVSYASFLVHDVQCYHFFFRKKKKMQDSMQRKVFQFNSLNANPTKWPNTLKQFVSKLPTNCLSVFGHFVNLALQRLTFTSLISWSEKFWDFWFNITAQKNFQLRISSVNVTKSAICGLRNFVPLKNL